MAATAAVDQWGFLPKWLVLGTIIGISAGLGAIVFYLALRLGTYLLLGLIGGYHVPTPVGEGGALGSAGFSRPWAIPLTAGLGGLLAGLVVFKLAPEAEGPGTDSAIDAFHHHPKGIRARVSAVKIVASALTIGSGGSGGREGPAHRTDLRRVRLAVRPLDEPVNQVNPHRGCGWRRLGNRGHFQRSLGRYCPWPGDPLHPGL